MRMYGPRASLLLSDHVLEQVFTEYIDKKQAAAVGWVARECHGVMHSKH